MTVQDILNVAKNLASAIIHIVRAAGSLVIHGIFSNGAKVAGERPAVLWLDVSRLSVGYNTGGISRTTHRISEELLGLDNPAQSVGFFTFSRLGRLTAANKWACENFPQSLDVIFQGDVAFRPGDTILSADLALPPRGLRVRTVRRLVSKGIFVVFILYDVLPIKFPSLFPAGRYLTFRSWLNAVISSSAVISISESSRADFHAYVARRKVKTMPVTKTVPLGSDFPPELAELGPRKVSQEPMILMVGTLEPRKDYLSALLAFELMWRQGRVFGVTILGKKGWKCEKVVRTITALKKAGRHIDWISDSDDSHLARAYTDAAFLLANSIDEGFGLPVAEALASGLPVLAQPIAPFLEIGGNHIRYLRGRTPAELSDDIVAFLESGIHKYPRARERGTGRSWREFASEVKQICDELASQG